MNSSEKKALSAAVDVQTYKQGGNNEEGELRLIMVLRDIIKARKFTRVVCFGMDGTLPKQVSLLLQYMTYVAGMEVVLQHIRPDTQSLENTVLFSYMPVPPGVTTH